MSFASVCTFVKKNAAFVAAGLERTKPAERDLVRRLSERFERGDQTPLSTGEEAAALSVWNGSTDLLPWFAERGPATALDILIRATGFTCAHLEWDGSVWVLRRAKIEDGLGHLQIAHWAFMRDVLERASAKDAQAAKAVAKPAAARSWLLRAALAFVFPNEKEFWSERDQAQLRQADLDSWPSVAFGTLAALRGHRLPPKKPKSWVEIFDLEHLTPAFVVKALGGVGAVPVFRLQRAYQALSRIDDVDAVRVFGEFAEGGVEYLGNEPHSDSTWPFIEALKPSAKVLSAFASLFTTHVPRRTVALPLARAQLTEWLMASPKEATAFARQSTPEGTFVKAVLAEIGAGLPVDDTWVSCWQKPPAATKGAPSAPTPPKAPPKAPTALPKVTERVHWSNRKKNEREKLAAADGEDRGPKQDAMAKSMVERDLRQGQHSLMLHVTWSSDRRALALFESLPPKSWYAEADDLTSLLARYELKALPSLMAFLTLKPNHLSVLSGVESPRVAPLMARALVKVKKHKPTAQRWLEQYPEAAVVGLWPLLGSKDKTEREGAEAAFAHLREKGLATKWLPAPSDDAATGPADVTEVGRWPKLPPKAPKLPTFIKVAQLPRPVRKDGRAALGVDALTEVLAGLKATLPERRDFADALAARFTPASLAALAAALFRQWLYADGPPKEKWALYASGIFANDDAARSFGLLATQWAPQGKSARAQETVELLAMLRTVTALSEVYRIATKVQSKALRARAEKVFATEAEKLGLTTEDLADRIIPEVGVPADGHLVLGDRTVVFDSQLKPSLVDESGQAHDALPATASPDDVEAWAELKKVAAQVRRQQVKRLEQSLTDARRMSFEHFTEVYVMHPLVRHLSRGLVWAAWRGSERVATFTVAKNGLVDAKGRPVEPPADATYGLVHPVDLPANELSEWKKRLPAERQPFAQLTREVFTAPAEKFTTYEREVPTGALLSLQSRGWRRGDAVHRGCYFELTREGPTWSMRLGFTPGIDLAAPTETTRQNVGDVRFEATGPVPRATLSELQRDLAGLTAKSP